MVNRSAAVGDYLRDRRTGLVFQVGSVKRDGISTVYCQGGLEFFDQDCDRATWREAVIDDLNRTVSQWPAGTIAALEAVEMLDELFKDPAIALFKQDWWDSLDPNTKRKIHEFYAYSKQVRGEGKHSSSKQRTSSDPRGG